MTTTSPPADGDDHVQTLDAQFSGHLVLDRGRRWQRYLASDGDASVVDADIDPDGRGVEVLQLSADAVDNAQSMILGAHASAGDLNTVDTTSVGADDVITIDASGFGDSLSINSGRQRRHVVLLGSGWHLHR